MAGPVLGRQFRDQARKTGERIALDDGVHTRSYAELNDRVNRLANALLARGAAPGDRVAILSENRNEYLETQLACAKAGLIAACQNWRQSSAELRHCVDLVAPNVLLHSPRHSEAANALAPSEARIEFGYAYEEMLAAASAREPETSAVPEDGLLILYTSGTTGYPKGALISHRAMIARGLLMYADWHLAHDDAFVAWAPLFHMASADLALATLCHGGTVRVIDGFDVPRLLHTIGHDQISWLVLMPGMIDRLIAALREAGTVPKGIRLAGCMANLVPPQSIADITALLRTPFLNSLGSTETGIAPTSRNLIPAGIAPTSLAKEQSSGCDIRLVDPDDREVPDGEVGEMSLRSATLFSGYWQADAVNQVDFRAGWFHMGDLFRRLPDGKLDFVDRKKYLIKSGGENIYPAEIEKVLMEDSRVADAVVVRRRDTQWGEVPVAYVVRRDESLTVEMLLTRCRASIASYKLPKAVHFVSDDALPRSETGKIKRHELEQRAADAMSHKPEAPEA